MSKPTLGIFGLTGCAGDQLALLACEDELLRIVELVDLRDFLMASSLNDTGCRLDVALVEGAVVSRHDEERLRAIRARAGLLGALGTCAVWGGVATLDRGADRRALAREIYGPVADGYDSLPARALDEVVKVDFAITGCPIDKGEVLNALASLLRGDLPVAPTAAVCAECRMHDVPCLFERAGTVCCGPITLGGCDALCPRHGIGCVGCRGPAPDANVPAWVTLLTERGIPAAEAARKLRTFAPIRPDGRREVAS
jgi:coenzyme F420-reducing hydrogenase gamma subunit